MAASSPLLSPPPLSLVLKHKPLFSISGKNSISPSIPTNLLTFPLTNSSKKISHFPNVVPSNPTTKSWKLSANLGNYSLSEANPVEISQEIVSTSENGGPVVISALLFAAFVGLSILTIGVIYIAVTDFLQKREREKFEKEEAAKKKRSGKKGKVRAKARTGPKGFGQKIEEGDDDELD